jgi:uncharacterized protein YcbX
MISVTRISIYPIKSTAPIDLQASAVQPLGLEHDRRRALVDAAAGRIMTARDYPQMLGISTQVAGEQLLLRAGGAELEIPLVPSDGELSRVKLWAEEQHPGLRYPDEVNRWFSAYLGLDCYLIAMGEGCVREFPTGMASGYLGRPGDAVSYADDYPLLVANEASLAELNTRLAQPVTMRNFRPNVVLSGCEAFAEDGWSRIRIGECELELAQDCPRCVMTTIDPETGQRHEQQEPLRTLASYRKAPGGAPFGIQMVPRSLGTLRIDDRVEVLARREA